MNKTYKFIVSFEVEIEATNIVAAYSVMRRGLSLCGLGIAGGLSAPSGKGSWWRYRATKNAPKIKLVSEMSDG